MPHIKDRIVLVCHTCHETCDVPNKGLGRATAAAWRTNHQGHHVEENPA